MKIITSIALGLLFALLIPACKRTTSTSAPEKPGAALHREPFHYMSDGLKITGLMSKPEGEGPFPVVLVNHGGFDPAKNVAGFLDFFASHGFVALASDYRGCGDAQGTHEAAKGEVNDIVNLVHFAQALPYAAPTRLSIWGFSHGGALALLAASRDQSVRSVISVQGPVEMADAWRHWERHQDKPGLKALAGLSTIIGGTPNQVPAAWRGRSALYVAAQIKCPVLLIYSADDHDDAVPTDQGVRMEQALRNSGNADVKLLLIPNAGHGLNEDAWDDVMTPMLEFVQSHSKP